MARHWPRTVIHSTHYSATWRKAYEFALRVSATSTGKPLVKKSRNGNGWWVYYCNEHTWGH